jgi:hypothetical protein
MHPLSPLIFLFCNLQVYTMRPFQGQSLAYGFESGVFGCKATGNGDEDLGATTICPDAPMTSNGPVIDWMAPQVLISCDF